MMNQLLNNTRQLTLGAYRHETDFEDKKDKSVSAIVLAKNKVRHEISDLKERLKQAQENIVKYKEELSKAEGGGLLPTQPVLPI